MGIRRSLDARCASTAVLSPSSGCCRPNSDSCRRGAESTCRWRRVRPSAVRILRHSGNSAHMIARLAPGVTLAGAQAQIDAHNALVETTDPAGEDDCGCWIPLARRPSARIARRCRSARRWCWCRWASSFCSSSAPSTSPIFCSSARPAGSRNSPSDRRSARDDGISWRKSRSRRPCSRCLVHSRVWRLGAAGIRLLAVLGSNRLPLGAQVNFDARVAIVALADSGRGRARHGRSDRLVQPPQPRRGHPAVAHAGRHGQPHRPAPAPWISRGADRAVVRPARRRWAARHQPAQGDGRAARISAGTRADRAGVAAVGTVLRARASVLASSPG